MVYKDLLLLRCGNQEVVELQDFEAEENRYRHQDVLTGAAGSRVHVVCFFSLYWIEGQEYIQNQECADDEDGQVPQLILLLILMIKQSITNEDGIDEDHEHVGNLYPLVVGMLHLVAHGVKHEVASLGEEPANHQEE